MSGVASGKTLRCVVSKAKLCIALKKIAKVFKKIVYDNGCEVVPEMIVYPLLNYVEHPLMKIGLSHMSCQVLHLLLGHVLARFRTQFYAHCQVMA